MNKFHLALLLLFSFNIISKLHGQDTIRIAEGSNHSSKEENFRGKGWFQTVCLGKEIIKTSDSLVAVNTFYYLDGKKVSNHTEYFLKNKSQLIVRYDDNTTHIWNFKIQSDSNYLIERKVGLLNYKSKVKQLLPLEIESYVAVFSESNDTIWRKNIVSDNCNKYHKTWQYPIEKYNTGDIIVNSLKKEYILNLPDTLECSTNFLGGYCYSQPFIYIKSITIFVKHTGEIIGVEQSFGNCDIHYCPSEFLSVLLSVYKQNFQIETKNLIKGQIYKFEQKVSIGNR